MKWHKSKQLDLFQKNNMDAWKQRLEVSTTIPLILVSIDGD